MNIALLGYGKMGKAIEQIALERGHEIILKIGSNNLHEATSENLKKADVVIEFTNPEVAFDNVSKCLQLGIPVVCGSTGWNHQVPEAQNLCTGHKTSFIQASNFSIGVNLFFEMNKMAAQLMKQHLEYQVSITEVHHTQKLDAPSGTAISLANQIIDQYNNLEQWSLEEKPNHLHIQALREDEVPGTHTINYHSNIDDITLTHTAHSRSGFALGAVMAAEFIHQRKGNFTMRDVLFSNH